MDSSGTGIGLALSRELVELHHGKINATSEKGKGSCFYVYLPTGDSHLVEIDIPEDKPHKTPEPLVDLEKQKPILLIVEDNTDMRNYICDYLKSDFQLIEAQNGKEGLSFAIEYLPDLIISDVMMPIMDGYQFSRTVKNDERTSHIPVILLTARASKESRLEGLKSGVDDFLTKPFEADELVTRVYNLIHQRDILKEKYRKEFENNGILSDISISSMDQKFLMKVKTIIESNMSDSDFSVETLAEMIALSRVQLHRKLKALLNQSASDFIRVTRLNRAAKLLKEKSANVSEIAYDVGFSSPSYFTECFRKQFGITPTDYNST